MILMISLGHWSNTFLPIPPFHILAAPDSINFLSRFPSFADLVVIMAENKSVGKELFILKWALQSGGTSFFFSKLHLKLKKDFVTAL